MARRAPKSPFTFHGAFTSKADAEKRERKLGVGAFIMPRNKAGRYTVATRNPGWRKTRRGWTK